MQKSAETPQVRVTIEMFYLAIAQEASLKAKASQTDWQTTDSLQAQLAMQDSALVAAIMATTALESFINVVAEQNLPPKVWEGFERLEVREKWKLLLYVLNCAEWDEGCRPFQDFSRLVSFRNKLVHYKPEYEPYEKLGIEDLKLEKELTGDNARRWYSCAREMIVAFHKKVSWEVPYNVAQEDYSARAEVQFR